MKITVRRMEPRRAQLLVEGTEPAFVNALRRTMVADVPKMAIDDVTIYDNTSGLFDEMISHRLGLLPIPTDLAAFVPRAECVCKGAGCPNCTLRYTLSKEGPGMVLSGDLQPENPSFALPDPRIPLVELLEGQRLILEVEAVLGTGKQHAKWQPVVAAAYKYNPVVTIDNRAIPAEHVKAIAESCPVDILHDEDGKLTVHPMERCTLCMNCVETASKLKGLARDQAKGNIGVWVEGDPGKFLFGFETDGSMTAAEALSRATKMLGEKYDELSKHVATIK